MDVENDVFVVLRCSNAWQGGVGGGSAVELESPEAILEIAGVGKGEGLRYLDDEAAFDEFEGLRILFRVLVLILCAWYFAQDLNARFCRMPDNGEKREADAQGNAKGQGVEDGGGEDKEHESKFRPATDVDEEFDVVGGFFDKRIGNDGYHC